MTTVACNRKYMAAESMGASGNLKLTGDRKLFRGPEGSVLGVAGVYTKALALAKWICGGLDNPPDDLDEAWVLQLRHDGIWMYEQTAVPFEIHNPFIAMGSGGDFAIGAMAAGADPFDAVKVATKYDVFSGGKIITMALEPKPKRPRKENV